MCTSEEKLPFVNSKAKCCLSISYLGFEYFNNTFHLQTPKAFGKCAQPYNTDTNLLRKTGDGLKKSFISQSRARNKMENQLHLGRSTQAVCAETRKCIFKSCS